MDAVVENALFAARQHLLALFIRETEFRRNLSFGQWHGGFGLGSYLQDREHEGLIVGDAHFPSPYCLANPSSVMFSAMASCGIST